MTTGKPDLQTRYADAANNSLIETMDFLDSRSFSSGKEAALALRALVDEISQERPVVIKSSHPLCQPCQVLDKSQKIEQVLDSLNRPVTYIRIDLEKLGQDNKIDDFMAHYIDPVLGPMDDMPVVRAYYKGALADIDAAAARSHEDCQKLVEAVLRGKPGNVYVPPDHGWLGYMLQYPRFREKIEQGLIDPGALTVVGNHQFTPLPAGP